MRATRGAGVLRALRASGQEVNAGAAGGAACSAQPIMPVLLRAGRALLGDTGAGWVHPTAPLGLLYGRAVLTRCLGNWK